MTNLPGNNKPLTETIWSLREKGYQIDYFSSRNGVHKYSIGFSNPEGNRIDLLYDQRSDRCHPKP